MRIYIIFLLAILTTASLIFSQNSKYQLEIFVGSNYLPLTSTKNKLEKQKNIISAANDTFKYNIDQISSYYKLNMIYNINNNNSLILCTGLLNPKYSFNIRGMHDISGGSVPYRENQYSKYSCIPIGMGYRYILYKNQNMIQPYCGTELTFLFSSEKIKKTTKVDSNIFNDSFSISGSGYGIHINFGLLYKFSRRFYFNMMFEGRYTDAFAFSGGVKKINKFKSIKSESDFSGLGFSFGIVYN
jgi:hypothetical protein